MNAEQNPLMHYDSLLQQYAQRVEPLLAQLHERVDSELIRIRHQEATLLTARSQALQALQTAIGLDARFILTTARFQEFFERQLNVKSKYGRDRAPQADDSVTNWSLARFDRPLRVFAYQEKFEPDDYDDENTYASYRFNVKVAWDETTRDITDIRALAIYGVNNYRPESFSDLAESIAWELEDFPDKSDPKNWLSIEELSYLVTYCCLLLAQKPSTIEFAYNSSSPAEHNLWELSI
jgi:hypothetical protein